VRMEWVLARYGQIIPPNWSTGQWLHFMQSYAPMGFMVADAQNVIVKHAIEYNYEWVLLVEDDTMPPPDAFLQLNRYIKDADIPVVSGLYYQKADPPEPLVYRGAGNSSYDDFVIGDKVWCDGIPTGFFLCSMKILKLMWDESPEYRVGSVVTRRVFDQPAYVWYDPQTGIASAHTGTSDLAWCKRVIEGNYIGRAGWPEIAKKKYPFLVDTNIFCRHITPDGVIYPPENVMPNMRKIEKPKDPKKKKKTPLPSESTSKTE